MRLYDYLGNIHEAISEKYYERLFGIKTNTKIILDNRVGYSNYAPSPYHYLASYFRKYPMEKGYSYVDFGCGMGRTVFLASFYGCNETIGVEVNQEMYDLANCNRDRFRQYNENSVIRFVHCKAEEFNVEDGYAYFYFYNPFHLKYFIKVINNIVTSYMKKKRNIRIILYCPADEYLRFLATQDIFMKHYRMTFKDGAFFEIYEMR